MDLANQLGEQTRSWTPATTYKTPTAEDAALGYYYYPTSEPALPTVQDEIGYGLEAVLAYTNNYEEAAQGLFPTQTPDPLARQLLNKVAAPSTFKSPAQELPYSQELLRPKQLPTVTQDDRSRQFLDSLDGHKSLLKISKNESART